MQQVKIFKGAEGDIGSLENEINAWIRENGAKIVSITGNIAPQSQSLKTGAGGMDRITYPPSDVLVILLYETG